MRKFFGGLLILIALSPVIYGMCMNEVFATAIGVLFISTLFMIIFIYGVHLLTSKKKTTRN